MESASHKRIGLSPTNSLFLRLLKRTKIDKLKDS